MKLRILTGIIFSVLGGMRVSASGGGFKAFGIFLLLYGIFSIGHGIYLISKGDKQGSDAKPNNDIV